MDVVNLKYACDLTREETELLSSKDYLKKLDLRVHEIEGGIVLPPVRRSRHSGAYTPVNLLIGRGGVLDKDNTYVEVSGQCADILLSRVYGAYDLSKHEIHDSDECVIYLNHFWPHWGHFLIDFVGRLWYVLKSNENCKLVYTCKLGENSPIKGNFLEFFELLGIDVSRLQMVNQVTRFKKVIIPESSILPAGYYTPEYKELFDKVIKNAGVQFSNKKKIYCSRSCFAPAGRKEENEADLESVFQSNGYESVYMEKLSLTEQIRTLNSAGELAMIGGTLSHNLLFVRNSAKAVLLNKTYRSNILQCMVNQITSAEIIPVDAFVAPAPITMGKGPFILKRTEEFMAYCEDAGFDMDSRRANCKLTQKEKVRYWLKWCRRNRRDLRVLLGKTELDYFQMSLRTIRRYYRRQQRGKAGNAKA